MCDESKRPNFSRAPQLTVTQILSWADDHHERTGKWPTSDSGCIPGALGDNWRRVDSALRLGLRGLPGGASLAQLLAQHRGVRNLSDLPPLTLEQILSWADAHQQRTGKWPHGDSGPVADAPGETWRRLDTALRLGMRNLAGGSSLAQLLAERRGVRNVMVLPSVTPEQILAWADAHHQRTGRWPTCLSGPIAEAPGVTWSTVQKLLRRGLAGRPAGWSLARLLAEERQVRMIPYLAPLTIEQILAWADAHRQRTGRWPRGVHTSEPVRDAPRETWRGIDHALRDGLRGLPGGSSLARLLATHRGARIRNQPPTLTIRQVLAWADEHHVRTGHWPNCKSGPVLDTDGETWLTVDLALRDGRRGLAGGSSLARLLAEQRGAGRRVSRDPLTLPQILAWADAHYRRHGRWPTLNSGRIHGASGESWSAVDKALRQGSRGLPGRSSLRQLIEKHRYIAEAAMQAEGRTTKSQGRKNAR